MCFGEFFDVIIVFDMPRLQRCFLPLFYRAALMACNCFRLLAIEPGALFIVQTLGPHGQLQAHSRTGSFMVVLVFLFALLVSSHLCAS